MCSWYFYGFFFFSLATIKLENISSSTKQITWLAIWVYQSVKFRTIGKLLHILQPKHNAETYVIVSWFITASKHSNIFNRFAIGNQIKFGGNFANERKKPARFVSENVIMQCEDTIEIALELLQHTYRVGNKSFQTFICIW